MNENLKSVASFCSHIGLNTFAKIIAVHFCLHHQKLEVLKNSE